MTFVDLYRINDYCNNIQKALKDCDLYYNEGDVTLTIPASVLEELKDVVSDSKGLTYDLCKLEITDVIQMMVKHNET